MEKKDNFREYFRYVFIIYLIIMLFLMVFLIFNLFSIDCGISFDETNVIKQGENISVNFWISNRVWFKPLYNLDFGWAFDSYSVSYYCHGSGDYYL